MSLALVSVPASDFDTIHNHVTAHPLGYGNMHLRQTRTVSKQTQLRYLHALVAKGAAIEGAISGPGIYWHYRLTRTQLSVLADNASVSERERIARQFLKEILNRVRTDVPQDHHPKRLAGHFYLRRDPDGSAVSHATCQAALAARILDPQFVAKLASWKLKLVRGR